MTSLPDFKSLSNEQLVASYGHVLEELRDRKIIRSKNVVGDLGEYLVIEHYKATPSLPNLQAAPTGTQNVDALSRDGERYSIKATTTNATGVFYGLPEKGSDEVPKQKFEYVVVVKLSDSYELEKMVELTWEKFLELRRWQSRMRAWNLGYSAQLVDEGKIVFPVTEGGES